MTTAEPTSRARRLRLGRGSHERLRRHSWLDTGGDQVRGRVRTLINAHYPSRLPVIGPEQADALDVFQVQNGRSFSGDSQQLTSYLRFGQPVLAPGDGIITDLADTLPDLPIGTSDKTHLEGNYLVLGLGGQRYVMFAHLKQGSARGAVGDAVERYHAVRLTVYVALLWAVWHIPDHFAEEGWGIEALISAPVIFAIDSASLFLASALFVWFYNVTASSVLLVAIFPCQLRRRNQPVPTMSYRLPIR